MSDETQQHYRRLISHVDANAARHPWYGPCDGLGKNGSCCECDKLIAALQQQLSEAQKRIFELEADSGRTSMDGRKL